MPNDKKIDTLAAEPILPAARKLRPVCEPEQALEFLLAVNRELNAADDLAGGLQRVAELIRVYVPYQTFAVLLLDDLGRELRFVHAEGFPQEVVDHWRFGMGQGIVGTAASTRKTVRVDDVRNDPRYIAATTRVGAELAIPLLTKDRIIGVLEVGGAEAGFFSEEDEQLLTFLAENLAGAIDNVRLYQNMRQQARNFSLLHEVTRELASILDRRELVHRVAVLVRRLIDYDLFSVLLWNEQTQLLDPWVAFSKDGPRTGEKVSMPLGFGLSGTAAALRQPVRVPNVQLDPRYVRFVDDLEVASELDIPLVFKERLIGVLNLESTRFNAFSNQHQQLLSTLASSVAIALENARLYEQLRRDERKLETDLSTAREMQKQLLPKSTPWSPGLQVAVGYEPALHLAGDFYDFLPYGRDRVAIAVGDVAGKATSAALYGTLAIGMLREYAAESRVGPARLLAEMNRKLGKLGFDNRFLAMLFAVYDKKTRRLTIANSGLPYPFVVRGRQVHRIDLGGVPLGLFDGQTYEETEIELAEGDAFLIASDGLEESMSEAGAEFGYQGVEATLRQLAPGTAQEISQGLLDAARQFSGSGDASDDRTIVVLKATPID